MVPVYFEKVALIGSHSARMERSKWRKLILVSVCRMGSNRTKTALFVCERASEHVPCKMSFAIIQFRRCDFG